MPTKLISKALLGVLSATILAAPAFAGGNCASGNCAMPVEVMPSYIPKFGPMTIRTELPMGHLRSIDFQRAPNVSITRIHGMMPSAALSDAPSGFTGGCHPTSTTYCRHDAGQHALVELNAPRPAAPVMMAPPAPVMMAPIAPAPVIAAPSEPRVVKIGGGYDPSKFTPRVYGDPTFVPGIAHVPTSIVDRDPVRAQQVLDSGRTVPQPVVVPGQGRVPQPGFTQMQAPMMPAPIMQAPRLQMHAPMMHAPMMRAPQMMGPRFGQAGAPLLQQSGPMAGAYGSSIGADGTYWEKVSGPTAFGDTIATSVICKRQLPTQTVRPVIGVPVPVPVPVPGCAPAQGQAHMGHGHRGFAKKKKAKKASSNGRYNEAVPGRWIH